MYRVENSIIKLNCIISSKLLHAFEQINQLTNETN